MVIQFLKPWRGGVPGPFGKMVGLGWSSAENLRPSNRELSFQARLYVGSHPAPKAPEGGSGAGPKSRGQGGKGRSVLWTGVCGPVMPAPGNVGS